MILRSLMKHVRDQNWFAVGLDFLIVVVGVFIGIQVANWNESRHEADRARGYLERIHTDLATDLVELDRRRAFWTRVTAYGHGAIAYAESGKLVEDSAWKTLLAFYQASQLYPFVPSDTTYQEMRSAGELGLLRDQAIREALASYYVVGAGYAANWLFRTEPEYRRLVRGLTPVIASRQVWAECHRSFSAASQAGRKAGGQALRDCDSPMTEAEAQAVLDGYLADPHLLTELRFWITNLEVMTGLISEHETHARTLSQRVNGAIQP
ncbi:MAG: hypothetical protein GVY32_01905 [Gammaproteobacteria bacterium]|jgi:hypothetical protein|nr:hypothetical protein [Gammaproteobacteria bacterium]